MPADETNSEVVVSGHYHSIDLLRITDEDVKKLRADGLTIHHPYPSEWIQNRSERVYQGFFEKIAVHVNGLNKPRRCPQDPQRVESLNASYLGFFETSHAKLTVCRQAEFDPKLLRLKWKHVELDEDSELYNFASIYYADAEVDDFEHDSVDEGFFLIDASEGIIELDITEHNATFTLREGKA